MNSIKKITEQVNYQSQNIDKKSIIDILRLINDQDSKVSTAVSKALPAIDLFISDLVKSMYNGGRLIYVGSGTSGRLGVLDASECPPTFNTDKGLVVGVIAGGKKALSESIENAEDDLHNGMKTVRELNLKRNDTILGISASGDTQFVVGAIDEGFKNKCTTGLLTFNDVNNDKVDHLIKVDVGPEIIAGSTRMKSGTATKMILNMITTTSMIKLNKTYGNLMIDLKVRNKKLLKRAINLIQTITGLNENESQKLLIKSDNNVKIAIVMHIKKISYNDALEKLNNHQGSLVKVIDE